MVDIEYGENHDILGDPENQVWLLVQHSPLDNNFLIWSCARPIEDGKPFVHRLSQPRSLVVPAGASGERLLHWSKIRKWASQNHDSFARLAAADNDAARAILKSAQRSLAKVSWESKSTETEDLRAAIDEQTANLEALLRAEPAREVDTKADDPAVLYRSLGSLVALVQREAVSVLAAEFERPMYHREGASARLQAPLFDRIMATIPQIVDDVIDQERFREEYCLSFLISENPDILDHAGSRDSIEAGSFKDQMHCHISDVVRGRLNHARILRDAHIWAIRDGH